MKAKRVNEVFASMDGRQRTAALVDGHSRSERASEAVRLVKSQGFEDLHLAYFKRQDLGGAGVWDVRQIGDPRCYGTSPANPTFTAESTSATRGSDRPRHGGAMVSHP